LTGSKYKLGRVEEREKKKWFRITNLKVAHGGLVTAMREERQ
jgi:hypothetical protein